MKNYRSKWILQRITALILIPLTFWFIFNCVVLSSQNYEDVKFFFVSKLNASLFLILMISMLYHAKLGCETIVEDYINSKNLKSLSKFTITYLTYIFMILTSLSILLITF